jgi:RNA polymerase sigma-70 factor, ECF subfamily
MMGAEVPLAEGEVDELVALIRAGAHRDAVALAAQQHGAAVGRLCMAMLGSQAEAEETLQDTLIAAHVAMASFRGEGTVRAWLFGIARRLCVRRLVTRGRQQRRDAAAQALAPVAELPDSTLQVKRRAAAVRQALERLSPTEREALLLRYQGDLSFREVAAACEVDEATARKRASRGLAHLRGLLGGRRDREDVS